MLKPTTKARQPPPSTVTKEPEPKWLKLESVRTLLMEKAPMRGREAHVGAASGLVKAFGKTWVAADDENAIAVFDGAKKGRWVPVLPGKLPVDYEARRKVKPDFESLAIVPPLPGAPHGGLLTLTSGSAPDRTKGAFVPVSADGEPLAARAFDLKPLLDVLGTQVSKLNIEGSVVVGDRLRLLHRGGALADNALLDVDLGKLMQAVMNGEEISGDVFIGKTPVALGELGGVPLGLSDASALPDGGIVFIASAEDTPDPTLDGPVTGSIIGIMGPDGEITARFPVKDLKLEGAHAEVVGDDVHVTLVVDSDDPSKPSPMFSAVLKGVAPKRTAPAEQRTGFEAGAATRVDPGAARADPAAFVETAKATRGAGWDTAVSTEAGVAVRKAQAELEHFAKLADAGGLKPELIRVAPFEAGAPESQWLTVKGDGGQPRVVWLVRNATGQVPEGLKAMAQELGVTDVAAAGPRGVEGATPIPAVADASPRASYVRAMQLADQLSRAAGVNPKAPELQLFRYTVARYLLNATTPQSLAYLSDTYQGDTKGLLATGQVPARWVEKLERGFKQPYTNDESLEWLRQMASKLTDAAKFVDEVNVNGSPITFYTAGSTTKARWSVGSDLDVLVDSPDKELEKKVLEGPFGFYGGANKEEFAILNASFYWDRGRFFGSPVELAKGTREMKPERVEEVFKQRSREDWGVAYRSTPEGTRLEFLPEAATKFVREAPAVSEVLYDYSRPTRAQLETQWVTEHWERVVKDAPQIRLYSRQRLVDEGNALVKALLPAALGPENVKRFFEAEGLPQPAPGADLSKLIPAMKMDEFLGLTDAAERLFVDFASSEQLKAAAEGTQPSPWAGVFGATANA